MIVIVVIMAGALLYLSRNPILSLKVSNKEILNFYAHYEVAAFSLALLTLGAIYLLAPKLRLSFLTLKNMDGPVAPSALLGIRKPGRENWRELGLSVGLIITVITAIVMLRTTVGKTLTAATPMDVIWVLFFALINAFTEEVIFRLSFATVGENDGIARNITMAFGAGIFGFIHYFGIAPNGFLGMILAVYIGFFLTKSILETKGFFWAWLIHFLQDVVIIGALTLWS